MSFAASGPPGVLKVALLIEVDMVVGIEVFGMKCNGKEQRDSWSRRLGQLKSIQTRSLFG